MGSAWASMKNLREFHGSARESMGESMEPAVGKYGATAGKYGADRGARNVGTASRLMRSANRRFGAQGWVVLVLNAVLAYGISFWPACWLVGHGMVPLRPTAIVYRPILCALHNASYEVAESVACGNHHVYHGIMRMKP